MTRLEHMHERLGPASPPCSPVSDRVTAPRPSRGDGAPRSPDRSERGRSPAPAMKQAPQPRPQPRPRRRHHHERIRRRCAGALDEQAHRRRGRSHGAAPSVAPRGVPDRRRRRPRTPGRMAVILRCSTSAADWWDLADHRLPTSQMPKPGPFTAAAGNSTRAPSPGVEAAISRRRFPAFSLRPRGPDIGFGHIGRLGHRPGPSPEAWVFATVLLVCATADLSLVGACIGGRFRPVRLRRGLALALRRVRPPVRGGHR